MRILRIDHVALAVPELDAGLPPWLEVLGLALGARERVPTQKVEAAFVLTPAQGEACVELIAPWPRGENAGADNAQRSGASSIEKFLQKRGGLHHIAFAVDDLRAALAELQERGVPLIDKVPRPGARGHQVAFLHPSALGGVLVELVSAHGGC